MTRVAIIDDHDLLRFGLKTVIEHAEGLEFAGERENGKDAAKFLLDARADVVLLDLRMPVVDGLAALEDIRANAPGVKVLVLTTSDVEEDILVANRIGVDGYALKTLPQKEIVEAIRAVARGERFFSPEVAKILQTHDSSVELTQREREILRLLSKGLSNPDIANVLDIAVETVKGHIKHIFAKLSVADRAEAVTVAFSRGLLKISAALAALAACFFADPRAAAAVKPLFDDAYTADPAPLVSGGRMYVYAGHDADDADSLKMTDWLCYSTADGTNWVAHGAVASPTNFAWAAENRAWACQCAERGGKFYLYASTKAKTGRRAIGVLVADSPTGPFTDPLGRPLVSREGNDTDPTVLEDSDGSVYLYWGLASLYVAKLNEDMVSFDAAFGEDGVLLVGRPQYYHSGPHVWKHGGTYYMAYSSRKIPIGVPVATAPRPEGPWTFRRWFVDATPRSPSQQAAVVEYMGKNWVFGYNYQRYAESAPSPRRHCERRSVWAKTFRYDAEDLPEAVKWWED